MVEETRGFCTALPRLCFCGSAFGVEEVRVSPGSCGEQMQMQTPEGVLMLAGPCDGENQCADTGGSELVAADLGGLNVSALHSGDLKMLR